MDRNDALTVKVPGAAYLAKHVDDDHSLDALMEQRVLPVLKIVQSMSDSALVEEFGEGSVIVHPGKGPVLPVPRIQKERGISFQFVALGFFTEFCQWRDVNDRDNAAVVERTFDPTHPVAKRAESASGRFQVYEGHENKPADQQFKYRFVKHLRFPGIIYGEHDLAGTTAVVTFERGELFTGTNFISAVTMRKMEIEAGVKTRVPLWCQVWQFTSSKRERGTKKWFGFDFAPGEPAIIQESEVEQFDEQRQEMARLIKARMIAVDDSAEFDEAGVDADTAANAPF